MIPGHERGKCRESPGTEECGVRLKWTRKENGKKQVIKEEEGQVETRRKRGGKEQITEVEEKRRADKNREGKIKKEKS